MENIEQKFIPPPVPAGTGRKMPVVRKNQDEAFADDFKPLDSACTPLKVIDCLLKAPGRIAYEIVKVRSASLAVILAMTAVVCFAAYGLIMATFSGGHQLWAVPLKMVTGTFLACVICLPSLYIFTSLCGARQTFPEALGLMMQAVALGGILLVGFAPVAWIFSQSTGTSVFMGILHLVFWIASANFGLDLLNRAYGFLNGRSMAILKVWGAIFLVVAMQMGTTLRPLVGEYEKGMFHGRKFFLAHWIQQMGNDGD